MNDNSHIRVHKPLPVSIALETGKLPPQAIDIEEAVLGAILIERIERMKKSGVKF